MSEKAYILEKSRNLAFRFTRGKVPSLFLLDFSAFLLHSSPKSLAYINQIAVLTDVHLKLNIALFTITTNCEGKMVVMWNMSLKPLAVKKKKERDTPSLIFSIWIQNFSSWAKYMVFVLARRRV